MLFNYIALFFIVIICQQSTDKQTNAADFTRQVEPPLAPSYVRLEQMINLFKKNSLDNSNDSSINDNMLPCLLKSEGCNINEMPLVSPKPPNNDYTNLTLTKSTIMSAVDGLQKKLDMKTAEIVKEIERRAAELRREIAIEAEEVGEAILYLTSMLGDSVMKADEMGVGFVREWFDEASQRYTGLSLEQKQKLNEEASIWDNEIHVYDSTESVFDTTPTHIKHSKEMLDKHLNLTREKYNYTNSDLTNNEGTLESNTENANLYEKAFDSVLVEKIDKNTNKTMHPNVLNNTFTSNSDLSADNDNIKYNKISNTQRRFGIYK